MAKITVRRNGRHFVGKSFRLEEQLCEAIADYAKAMRFRTHSDAVRQLLYNALDEHYTLVDKARADKVRLDG